MSQRLTHQYQVALIDPAGTAYPRTLASTLRSRVQELGLKPSDSLRLLDHRLQGLDRRAPLAGIYFGGPVQTPEATQAVEKLLGLSSFLLPVVPRLKGYSQQVPPALEAINGMALDPADPSLEGVARHALESLGLLRNRRRVFISYRRDCSSRVAEQLYHAFDLRSFEVFLDTHSVPRGELFQSVLWDRMSDTDLLVLLDAPGTLGKHGSRWVAAELTRAHRAGLGVLQLLWPGHSRAPETEFCYPEYLTEADFRRGPAGRAGGLPLRQPALRRIVTLAESLRARSLAARRSRLVNEFCQQTKLAGLSTVVQPAQHIDLRGPRNRVRVYPVVGHPDSLRAQEVFDVCRKPPVNAVLLYDPDGMQDRRLRHLRWLNEHLPAAVKLLPVTEIPAWAGAL